MTRSTGIGGGGLAAETGVGWLDVEAGPDATLIVDAGGLISRANAAALALLGYPREELVGSSVDVLLPERILTVCAPRLQELAVADLLRENRIGHLATTLWSVCRCRSHPAHRSCIPHRS